jgi:hypothetical protein
MASTVAATVNVRAAEGQRLIVVVMDADVPLTGGLVGNFWRPGWRACLVSAVTPATPPTQATTVVLLVIFVKIIGGYLPTSGTFSSNDHRR